MAQCTPPPAHGHDAEAAAWLYRHSGDGFAVVKDRRVVSVNPAWCSIMRTTAEEQVGKVVLDLVHPDDRAVYLQTVAELERAGEAVFEHRLRSDDGKTVWVRAAVKRGSDGLTMIVLRDVTAEREQRIEAELASQSTDMLRASAGIHMWRFDPDSGRYTIETAKRADTGAHETEDVSTGQMSDNIHPDDVRGFGKVFMPTVITGEAGQHVYRYKVFHPDLGEIWARYRTAWRGVRRCESGKWEIRGITQDITEIADARDAALRGEQAAREAAETKSRFLANMSHEIRTPLNGVLGVLHLLKNEALSPDGRQLIDQALGCGGMLTQLLNDLLDFSKIEAGKLELNPEPLDPVATLEGVVGMLRPAAEARGLYLRTVVTGAVGWVSVDPVRLRQALFNLIGNAAKFTLRGGVEVRLSPADGAMFKTGKADGASFVNFYATPAPAPSGPPAPKDQTPVRRGDPAPASGVVRLQPELQGRAIQFKFAWRAPLGAAVFRRGDAIWMVFDAKARIDVSGAPHGLTQFRKVEAVEGKDFSAIRIIAPPTTLASADAQGPTWVLTLGPNLPTSPQGVALSRDDTNGPPAITAQMAGSTGVFWIDDPAVGDRLAVVTALGPSKGLDQRRQMVDAVLLASTQGIAIQPMAEDLAVSADGDIVRIGRPRGLDLSPATAQVRHIAPAGPQMSLPSATSMPALIDFKEWSRTGEGGFMRRYAQLFAGAADEAGKGKSAGVQPDLLASPLTLT